MSSILKALKKLESDKPQRDELSTAVASDILRNTRSRKNHVVLQVVGACFAIVLIAATGYFLAVKTITVQPEQAVEPTTLLREDTPSIAAKPQQKPVTETTVSARPAPVENLPHLSGIIYQPNPVDRLAIINDLPVMEGTLVADFEVKSIYPDRVVLQRGNSEFTLKIKE